VNPVPKFTANDMPPSRPLSAYMIFISEYRKGLTAESKPRTFAEGGGLTKQIAMKWQNLSEAEKQVRSAITSCCIFLT
jgi:hypothetical protein